MPRTGGVYYLPSPPSPLQPNTLAAAEDVMTLYQDIATALTGSMAVDGSTAFTGPINFNNQTMTGVNNLTAGGTMTGNIVTANSYMSTPNYYGTNASLTGTISSTGGRVISQRSGGNPSFSCWDTSQNYAAGMFLGSGDTLYLGGMDGSGNYSGAWFISLNNAGYLNTASGVSIGGDLNMQGHNVVSAGTLYSTNANIGGTATIANFNGGLNFNSQTNFNALINANNQVIANIQELTGYNGVLPTNSQFIALNNIGMNGTNIYNVGTITYVGRAATANALQAVRTMAAQRGGDRDLVAAVEALIEAVAELSVAMSVPA